MVITRDQYQRIAADVEAALAPVGEAHGLELRLTNGKYGDRFQVLVQGLVASEPGAVFNPNAPEAQAYIRNAEVYGLPADGLGRTVTLNGREFVIVGLNPRAPKLPVLAVSNGQTYKLRVGSVLAGLVEETPIDDETYDPVARPTPGQTLPCSTLRDALANMILRDPE